MLRRTSIRAAISPDKAGRKRRIRPGLPVQGCSAARKTPARRGEKTQEKKQASGTDALLSLDSARRRVYIFWIHFLLRINLMAHKKIERAKELDRRRHRRAQRIKERIHEAKAAAKK